jgi:hypothetical protein
MVITKRRVVRLSMVALVAGAGAVAVTVALSMKQELDYIAKHLESRSVSG